MSETKACGCHVGFCRAETMLDAATVATMCGDAAQAERLAREYRRLMERCAGGWRAVPPREEVGA